MNLNPLNLIRPATTDEIMKPFFSIREKLNKAVEARQENIKVRNSRIRELEKDNVTAEAENEKAKKAMEMLNNFGL